MCPAVPPQVNRIFMGKHLVLICLFFSPAYPFFGAGICRDTDNMMPISASWMSKAVPP